jgi:hypothetical protein
MYIAVTILQLQFMLHVMLLAMLMFCAYNGTVRICVAPNKAVFCSSLISYFPGIFLRHFLHDFYMFAVAPIITDTSLLFLDVFAKLRKVCPSVNFCVCL